MVNLAKLLVFSLLILLLDSSHKPMDCLEASACSLDRTRLGKMVACSNRIARRVNLELMDLVELALTICKAL